MQVAPDGQGGVYVVWLGLTELPVGRLCDADGPNGEALWTEPVLLSSSTEFD